MKTLIKCIRLWLLSLIVVTALTGLSQAAQQYQGLCSYVKIEILQELTLERIGFLATLTVTNNEGDASITDFSAGLTFEREGEGGEMEDASSLFFVQPPKISGVTSIDGTGIISPGETATVEWFIIPKLSAGGITPEGLRYQIGALLAGSIYGQEIAQDVFRVLPDTIQVKPDPEFEITYFQPRDVDGDNPFTPDVVESPIPFTLGVRVKNVGYGTARKVKIASEQPRIIENEQGLLIVPQLIGSRVDDDPTDSTTLTVNLGDIEPGSCRKGAWDMITTLSGEFLEFKASYTHAPELGGEETSLIRSINAYFMVHEVLNDQPGRDGLLDFLAETQDGEDLIPDTLYESDCNTLPVNQLTDVEVLDFSALTATIRANADFENWVFFRLDDPGQAKYPIASVVRSDGKVINPNNYWTHIRYRESDNAKLTYLNIFDFVSLGEYQYTVSYESLGQDSEAPVTTLLLSGSSQKKDETYYLLAETQVFFIADDDSPVGTYYRLDGEGEFKPAYPFTIETGGAHTLEFYSEDIEGNTEAVQTALLHVSLDDPGISSLSSDTDELFIAGESISVRPTQAVISFNGVMTASRLDAVAEVYKGIFVYPTVAGVPASPTPNSDATLTIGGENVDYYRYKTGTGVWSSEFEVSEPIVLSGLSGSVDISVSGRSQYGDYHSDEEAVTVSWTVDVTAPAIEITGLPHTPTRSPQVTLNVAGASRYCYRVDDTYYRPESSPDAPIILEYLADGDHSVDVLARGTEAEACPGDVEGTRLSWAVDRGYGLSFPVENRIKYQELGQVDDSNAEFVWDGRTDGGVVAPPGWYTVKITVTDGLNRSYSMIRLIHVGDMIAGGLELSDAGNAGQKEAHAFGKWVVWQDQRNENWDIYARDLSDPAGSAIVVTSNAYNQERPRTDGQFVVWEDRQADGTWDIRAKELDAADPAFSVTSTPDTDERRPVVYWPWIVYQARAVATPDGPWQLKVVNLLDGITQTVDATGQDQLDPSLHKHRLVWQDFRDSGYGEIYMKDLKTGEVFRITNNPGGQYYPVVYNQWIVWADNRDLNFDLYGYNLKRQAEVRLTSGVEDETRPYISGNWVVFQEDAAGEGSINLRLLSLENLASVQLTNESSEKEKPSMAAGTLIWVDRRTGTGKVMAGPVPDLQPVFNNRNTIAVTGGMVTHMTDAYALLNRWHQEAGVTGITRYTSLLPQPVSQSVTWSGTGPSGTNFLLEPGSFFWVKFNDTHILDLGTGDCQDLTPESGGSVFSYACFPDQYTAYKLVRELGVDNVHAVRMLDAGSGRWRSVSVSEGEIRGENFTIPKVSVIMLDLKTSIGPWRPGETL